MSANFIPIYSKIKVKFLDRFFFIEYAKILQEIGIFVLRLELKLVLTRKATDAKEKYHLHYYTIDYF